MSGSTEPSVSKWALGIVSGSGLAATVLSVASEFLRDKRHSYLLDYEGKLLCHYPESKASPLAFTACGLLLLAVLLANSLSGCLWCMNGPHYISGRFRFFANSAVFLMWFFFAWAFGLLLYGGIEDRYHTMGNSNGSDPPNCSIVAEGIFGAAATSAFFCTLFAALYYLLGVKVRREIWRAVKNYSSSSLEVDLTSWKSPVSGPLPTVFEETV